MSADSFDELLDMYLLGELNEQQWAEFQAAIATDSAARARFVQSVSVEAHLHRLGASGEFAAARASAAPRWKLSLRGLSRWQRGAVAAILLIAVTGMIVFYALREDSSLMGRVESGSVLVDGKSGDRIREGSSVRITGMSPAVIHLADGSIATLDPGTQLVVKGREKDVRQVIQLAGGGGQFQVSHGGGQFRIDTAAGSVTVLGTQFTAVLRAPGGLYVSVTAGTVRLDGQGKSMTLGAGQSGTLGVAVNSPLPSGVAEPLVASGTIGLVDSKNLSFVLAESDGSESRYKAGSKTGDRETDVFLDGRKST